MANNAVALDKETTSDGLMEKLVQVRRVASVEKGGRTFRFSALVVVGDGAGRVGVGKGSAREVPVAIQKASERARRHLKKVVLNKSTIACEMRKKVGATKVFMKPAGPGTGIIAGGPMRAVFEVIGVQNVLTKIVGSSNPLNVVRATVAALLDIESPKLIAAKRNKTIKEIIGQENDE